MDAYQLSIAGHWGKSLEGKGLNLGLLSERRSNAQLEMIDRGA